MLIKRPRKKPLANDEPMRHADHARPRSRRDFISQGFAMGAATFAGPSLLGMLGGFGGAHAAIDPVLKGQCGANFLGANKIPFICFDLAGGANIAGSNVLVGGSGGQRDFLSTAGYNKLGLPGDMVPNGDDFVNTDLGLAFHSESALLRGIKQTASLSTLGLTNGVVIAARSENDTGNNPHNPMYGIARAGINNAGADGSLLGLIGSQSSTSGGNSMAPMSLIDSKNRPTKIDRPSDARSLVDVGNLNSLLSTKDAVAVMESIHRISDAKMSKVNTGLDTGASTEKDDEVKKLVQCGYVKSAAVLDKFNDPASLDPSEDPKIKGGIFSEGDFNSDREFQKTSSVMKLVIDGLAGAGTITMGGYDYHTGERGTGERRDERAGRCIGACLEYAALVGKPLMLYVFSDGSVSSNGRIDDSEDGGGKGEWTGDNQQTAASFYLVFNPNGRTEAIRNQIGYMRSDASVETASSPAANNVNQLVQTVILNYMALHGEEGSFASTFMDHGLGNATFQEALIGMPGIVNGTIPQPT
jgi:hypothetical protein